MRVELRVEARRDLVEAAGFYEQQREGLGAYFLATAGENFAFRGLEVAPDPDPEPSTLRLAGVGVAIAGVGAWKRRAARVAGAAPAVPPRSLQPCACARAIHYPEDGCGAARVQP